MIILFYKLCTCTYFTCLTCNIVKTEPNFLYNQSMCISNFDILRHAFFDISTKGEKWCSFALSTEMHCIIKCNGAGRVSPVIQSPLRAIDFNTTSINLLWISCTKVIKNGSEKMVRQTNRLMDDKINALCLISSIEIEIIIKG